MEPSRGVETREGRPCHGAGRRETEPGAWRPLPWAEGAGDGTGAWDRAGTAEVEWRGRGNDGEEPGREPGKEAGKEGRERSGEGTDGSGEGVEGGREMEKACAWSKYMSRYGGVVVVGVRVGGGGWW